MNFFQKKAQNKASEDRRKGARQGAQIVAYMRKEADDKNRENQVPNVPTVDSIPQSGNETPGHDVRAVGDEAVQEDRPTAPLETK